jgi:putative ABC transport system permease protein
MFFQDVLKFTLTTIRSHRLRTVLTMLGIAIGTASVILLTSIGEGLRIFMLQQFTQFGTNLIAVYPGKSETHGMPGIATTTRKLTLDDAEALQRVPGIEKLVPLCFGTARVEVENRSRSVFIYGVTPDVREVWKFEVRQGTIFPKTDMRRGAPLALIGPTLKSELFGAENALGKHIRIGGRRFVVMGVTASKGQMLGIDIDDSAWVPVGVALKLFNKEGLNEIDLLFAEGQDVQRITERVREVLKQRHDNEEDFTIISQTEMLETLDRVLRMLTMGVGAIAAISLFVGAIGILTMMWISVNERISEIGLQKAIGAEPSQILFLFLIEAGLLSTTGGLLGVFTGLGLAQLLGWALPSLPVQIPTTYVVLSLTMSVMVGLLSGVVPARRASRLDPLEALRAE